LLVEVADRLRPATVSEIGTGSGAVALAVADELQEAELVATDTSLDALAVAERNRRGLGCGERVRLVHGSIPPPGPYDLVLANLPYVGESEWPGLAPEITRFEPRAALVGGPTGLEPIERLLGAVALGELATRAIALEVGAGQAAMVGGLVRRTGFERVRAVADLAGIDRVVVGEGRRLGSA
jgi:release factor glutamine methyltransferase